MARATHTLLAAGVYLATELGSFHNLDFLEMNAAVARLSLPHCSVSRLEQQL